MTPRFVQRLGIAIAAAGLFAGAVVAVSASADAVDDAVAQRQEMRVVERLSGTAGVRTVEFDQWLGSWWHGRRLGVTLALLGLLVGGACWHVGGLMAEADDD